MASIGTLQQRLIEKQKLIDKKFRPTKELFAKDPKKYMTQWKKYLKQTEQAIDEFKVWLDYYPSEVEEETNKTTPRSRKLKTASVDLARTAKKLDDTIGGEFYAHFIRELDRLKSNHKDYSNTLKLLDTSSPDAFTQSFKNIARDLPRNIKEELKALPYEHPATLYLKLNPEQYAELNRAAERRKLEKHENISSVSLKKVMAYVGKVYEERHTIDYSHICIALQLATGRRRAELGLLSKITPSENLEGHITIDRFAKSNNTGKVHDLPVVFLTVKQVTELHGILQELLDTEVFADKKQIWEEIKRKSDTDRFDDYTKRVRITFLNEFRIRGFDVPESDTENLTVHNACRSIYAKFAYMTRQPLYRKMSLLAFVNRVLGHVRGDYKVTENYLRVDLIDDRFDPPSAEEAVEASSEPLTTELPSREAENPSSTPLAAATPEMDGSTKETSSRTVSDPFKPKRTRSPHKKKPGETTAPLEKIQNLPLVSTPVTPPEHSALTATPWEIKAPGSETKRNPIRLKSVAKAPAATRKFFEAVRSPAFIKALMLHSHKVKEPGLIDIQRALNVQLDSMPALEDLRTIASENAVNLYLKFLKKHRIEHAIEAQAPNS